MQNFLERNKQRYADQQKKPPPEGDARREQQAKLDAQIKRYRQNKQDYNRKREQARRQIQQFFLKLRTK